MQKLPKFMRSIQLGVLVFCLAGCLSLKTDAVPSNIASRIFLKTDKADNGHDLMIVRASVRDDRSRNVLEGVLIDVAMIEIAERTLSEGHTYYTLVETDRDRIRRHRQDGTPQRYLLQYTFEYYLGEPIEGKRGSQRKMNARESIAELQKGLDEMETYMES